MLTNILNQFEAASGPLCVDEIALRLEAEPATLEAILDLLVQMGRLTEIGGADACLSCPTRAGCYLVPAARRAFILAAQPNRNLNSVG
jgi:hypothetical protein